MKKIILSAIFIISVIFEINAQDYKWYGGGQITLWTGKEKTCVVVAPELGYGLNEKFTIAAAIGFHSISTEDKENEPKRDMRGFVLNPYIRYSAIKKNIITVFIDGGAEFGLGDFDGVQIGLKPGIAIGLTDRFSAVLHYGFIGYSDGKGTALNSEDEGFGISLSGYQSSLGFYYSF